jgi:thymidylate kinase
MKEPKFLTITGLDGSGKTTLANNIIEYYKARGYKYKYVWMRHRHTLAYLLMRLLMFLGWKRNFKNANGVEITRFELDEGTFSRVLWPIIEFLSILPVILFKVTIPLRLGYGIICDRYTIDTIVSISLNTYNMNFEDGYLGKIFLNLIPKEGIIIFLDIDLLNILSRRPDIEFSYDEIQNAIRIYRKLAIKTKAIYLNTTTQTPEQIKKRVISYLFGESISSTDVPTHY